MSVQLNKSKRKRDDKEEDDSYLLLREGTLLREDTENQSCNDENCQFNNDSNSDYYNSVFELLKSLVQKDEEEYDQDQQSDKSLHAEFERVVSSPIVRTSNPATPPLSKMPSSLVKNRSTQKQKIYEYDTRAEDNKYKKFSDRLFTVTIKEEQLDGIDGQTESSQKMSSTNVIDNKKRTLYEQTTIEGKKIKLVIEREDKYFRHNYPHTPPYQRAIYFKFYIGLQEYFHCTFIISSENNKTYCTSVHYTTRLGRNPVYIYIDLDTIISVFENECQSDVIKFLVFLLENFKDNDDETQKSRKFKCFLGIMACNSGTPGIDAAELQTIINEFTDTLQGIVLTGGKLKNRKKTTTAKPKTTTAKPKTTTAKPKTTTAKPKTTTAKPKTTTAKPKTTTAKPKTTTAKPKTTTAKPKTTTAKPKTTTAKPKTTTAKPKTTTAKPKTTTAKPKTTTAKPKTTTAKPKTTTAKPKTTTAKPKTTTAKPKTTTSKSRNPK